MEVGELKKKYEQLAKKHKLPSFDELNSDFEIDKLDRESNNLLRAIRKLIMEKIVNSMSFLEMLVNPINAPRMYVPYIATMEVGDKKIIDEIYSSLAGLSVLSLELEINSEEKDEAVLINSVLGKWKELKPKFSQILKNIKEPKNSVAKKERSYFG